MPCSSKLVVRLLENCSILQHSLVRHTNVFSQYQLRLQKWGNSSTVVVQLNVIASTYLLSRGQALVNFWVFAYNKCSKISLFQTVHIQLCLCPKRRFEDSCKAPWFGMTSPRQLILNNKETSGIFLTEAFSLQVRHTALESWPLKKSLCLPRAPPTRLQWGILCGRG